MLTVFVKRTVNKTQLFVEETALLSCVLTGHVKGSSSYTVVRLLHRGTPAPPSVPWQCPSGSSSEELPGSIPLFSQPHFPLKLYTKKNNT